MTLFLSVGHVSEVRYVKLLITSNTDFDAASLRPTVQ